MMSGFSALVKKIRGSRVTKRSAEIDKFLSNDKAKASKEYKVLLLGTGDSGKSTVFKQMMFLYGKDEDNSVTDQTLKGSARPCFSSFLADTITMLNSLTVDRDVHGFTNDSLRVDDEAEKAIPLMKQLNSESNKNKPELIPEEQYEEFVNAIKMIWSCDGVQEVWNHHRAKLQINEAWEYFALKVIDEKSEDYFGKNWFPSAEDYIKMRVKTAGVNEKKFPVNKKGDTRIVLVDVGGQKSERKKWLGVFNKVPVVLFVASLSEYNQTTYENVNKNRLQDTLEVFEWVVNNHYFQRTNFVLFLNKEDLFKEKLEQKIPFSVSGVEGAPDHCDYEKGLEWYQSLFQDIFNARQPPEGAPEFETSLKIYVTTAINKENADRVLTAVREFVLTNVVSSWIF